MVTYLMTFSFLIHDSLTLIQLMNNLMHHDPLTFGCYKITTHTLL